MSNFTCPYCNNDTDEDYNFCIICVNQVKCLNSECGAKLFVGRDICLKCGQKVARPATSQPQNTYVRDVTQKGRNFTEHVEFHLSDSAIGQLAPAIAGQIVAQTLGNSGMRNSGQSAKVQSNTPAVDASINTPQLGSSEESEKEEEKIEQKIPANGAMRFFERDGEQLVATEKDFKGAKWADQQKNFILLVVSAYNEHFQNPVPNEEFIRSMAKKTGVSDTNNFKKYLDKALAEHLLKLENGFSLNDRGKREVVKILADMDNSEKTGYEYWSKAPSTSTTRHRLSKEDKSRIQQWVDEKVELGKLDVLSIDNARDYALLSIWAITVQLKKAAAVHHGEAYFYLKQKFQAISATPEAFSAAVRSEFNKKFFRVSEDKLFLSDEAKKIVEGWITNGLPTKSD